MISDQELIDKFNFSYDPFYRWRVVKEMESLSRWDLAAAHWLKIGKPGDALSCRYIADAIAIGDEIRSRAKHLFDWAESAVEAGVMSYEEALRTVYPKVREIELQFKKELSRS